jgi:hypothetical protein
MLARSPAIQATTTAVSNLQHEGYDVGPLALSGKGQ